jgi:hypothetical protein
MDRREMEDALAEMEAAGLEASVPEAQQLRELLQLPEEDLLQRQLMAAINLNRVGRVAQVTQRMKDAYFKRHGFADFRIMNFPALKTPLQFAQRDMFRDRSSSSHKNWSVAKAELLRREQRMMCHSEEGIHTSLTHLPHSVPKSAAVHAFDVFLRYTQRPEDEKCSADVAAVISMCVRQPAIRDEVYVQLIKQCTKNGSTRSTMLYWQLLDMCLECFPPSEDFENFLEAFIRQRYDTDARLRKLHVILYVGRQTGKTPTDAQVRDMVRDYGEHAPPSPSSVKVRQVGGVGNERQLM